MKMRIRRWIWPSLCDLRTARDAARLGTWAAGAVALIAALSATANLLTTTPYQVDAWAYLDALQFVAIAFAIHKMSRTAAIGGLLIYLLQRVATWIAVGPGNVILAAAIILAFVSSVRGTFVYHRLAKTPPQ